MPNKYLIISVSSGNWSLIGSSSQRLPDISDGYNNTCHGLNYEDGHILLKSDIGIAFKTLHVTVHITGGEVDFFRHTDAFQCKKHASVLMTHDTSVASVTGQECKPFCEVPGPCQYDEMIMLAADKTDYVFSCICPQTSCNELFVWFQTESAHEGLSLCEVQLLYP